MKYDPKHLEHAVEFPKPDRISEALDRAADMIEKQGWCKGTARNYYIGGDGTRVMRCAGSAINDALFAGGAPSPGPEVAGNWLSNPDWLEAARRVLHLIGPSASMIDGTYHPLINWNDALYTTKEEVVAKLRAAAKESV